jgi:hypothetical protein
MIHVDISKNHTKMPVPLWQKYVPLDKLGKRDWKAITDGHLLAFTLDAIERNGIKNRSGFQKADSGLYHALGRRGLLEKVGLEPAHRDWASLTNDQLVSHAQKFVEENGIRNRSGLQKADRGLYRTLRKRGLLDTVFAPIEQKKQDELLGQLAEAIDVYTEK